MFKNSELFRVLGLMKNRIYGYFLMVITHSLIQAIFLNAILAFIMKDAINAVLDENWSFLQRALLFAATSLIIGMGVSPITIYIRAKIIRHTMADLQCKTYHHMQHLTVDSVEKHHSGDIISRLTNDVKTVENIYTNQMGGLIFTIVYGLTTMGSIFLLNWKIGCIVFVFGCGSVIINKRFSNPLRKRTDKIQTNKGLITKTMIDVLEGIRTTKIFGLEKLVYNQYKMNNEELKESKDQKAKLDASLNGVNVIYQHTSFLAILIIGLTMAMNHMIDIGSIAAIIHLQGNASFFFDNIGSFISGTKSSLAGASRVFEFLDRPIEENDNKKSDKTFNEFIALKDIVFGYEESDPILNHLSLQVKKGEVTALVGPSGGGKSTVLKLLMRFYSIKEGIIFFEGKDINDCRITDIRNKIAYVPQDAYLFSGSIAENISYGNKNASMEDVINAAKMAYAHDFIMAEPDGYNTMVGEKGAKLSGGQKQRIAIARALLKNAPVLLLDEATSALDSDSEQMVQKALDVLMEGRTTIVIAHRLSTIRHADKIYVIENGIVVEEGVHDELLAHNGIYKRLNDIQFANN